MMDTRIYADHGITGDEVFIFVKEDESLFSFLINMDAFAAPEMSFSVFPPFHMLVFSANLNLTRRTETKKQVNVMKIRYM